MSQNQTPSDGDKSLNRPPFSLSEAERSQLQYFNRELQDIQPQQTSMQHRAKPALGLYVGPYAGVNLTPTASASQFGTLSTAYGSASSMSASQQPVPTTMAPLTHQAGSPPNYPGYRNLPNTMAYGGSSGQMLSTYTYGQGQSSHNPGNVGLPQQNQWSAGQTGTTDVRPSAINRQGVAMANFLTTPQNNIPSVSSSSLLPSASPPQRATQSPFRSNPRTSDSPTSSRGRSPTSRGVGGRKTKTKSRTGTPGSRTAACFTAQGPIKWMSGMKDRKITADMTPEEVEEAQDYNRRLAEAKKAHTREQNRVSAQKSRAKKVELLQQTKSQVDELLDDNEQLQQLNTELNTRVQGLERDNLQLRTENDALRYRLAIYEETMAAPIRTPFVAVPPLDTSTQTQNQVAQTGAAGSLQSPGLQNVGDFPLTTTNAARPTADLGPLDNTLLAQEPTSNFSLDHPLPEQPEQHNIPTAAAQEGGDLSSWLLGLSNLDSQQGTDGQTWGPPSKTGAQ
ncbi:hypothetical protein F5Y05DRAFT_420757 [Hypoxylon sp. FL0543]|nr:hypothetical protein F5Y05DRAFT_420757 [Hypoxylon sp. FL0543]